MKKPHDDINCFRICQGDIFENIVFVEEIIEKEKNLLIEKITFPEVIVLSQDCDLQSEYFNQCLEHKKYKGITLISIIVSPLYDTDSLINIGDNEKKQLFFKESGLKPIQLSKVKTKFIESIEKYESERYHMIEFTNKNDTTEKRIIDFKQYFTVSTPYLIRNLDEKYIGSLEPIYREKVTQRFCNYLSRIGLPPSENEIEIIKQNNSSFKEKKVINKEIILEEQILKMKTSKKNILPSETNTDREIKKELMSMETITEETKIEKQQFLETVTDGTMAKKQSFSEAITTTNEDDKAFSITNVEVTKKTNLSLDDIKIIKNYY